MRRYRGFRWQDVRSLRYIGLTSMQLDVSQIMLDAIVNKTC